MTTTFIRSTHYLKVNVKPFRLLNQQGYPRRLLAPTLQHHTVNQVHTNPTDEDNPQINYFESHQTCRSQRKNRRHILH